MWLLMAKASLACIAVRQDAENLGRCIPIEELRNLLRTEVNHRRSLKRAGEGEVR